ncbi:protein of unknown function [Pseudodesulfovibrio profundus]|uniref:Uncharacterized protein n=1 Tax=Pseudodesulfovibrio profundus TaxID=57320 RepID=A0A2C8FB41_9BACT|nr:protein of unknown function [Pseudodesulfovibrio profundus]
MMNTVAISVFLINAFMLFCSCSSPHKKVCKFRQKGHHGVNHLDGVNHLTLLGNTDGVGFSYKNDKHILIFENFL